jgi:molybdenum cofactor cytidylyltransferase
LLAAGRATRFGGDKLGALVDGESVISRSAGALAATGCDLRIAVLANATRQHGPALKTAGYEIVENPDADLGLSTSIRAGVAAADARGARAVLIALADMPYVSDDHYGRLIEAFNSCREGLVYTRCGDRRMPPAIFSHHWFTRLCSLTGDNGARDLIHAASTDAEVSAPPDMARDIDRQTDLS